MSDVQFLITAIGFFIFVKILFNNDPCKDIIESTKINKKFKDCFIIVYPNHFEFHNKKNIYLIPNLEDFYKLNPKLKGKIKEIKKDYPLDNLKKEPVKCVKEKVREEINTKFKNK